MEQKRVEGKQRFKKGGKLDQGMGALKGGLEPPYKLWEGSTISENEHQQLK